MEKLTDREFEVYMYIISYREKNGFSPSMRDICKGVYLASPRSASYYIQRLLEKGYINYTPRVPRSIVIKQKSAV